MHKLRAARPLAGSAAALAWAAATAAGLAVAGCAEAALAAGSPVPSSALPQLTVIARGRQPHATTCCYGSSIT
jgi:hypothetical protein